MALYLGDYLQNKKATCTLLATVLKVSGISVMPTYEIFFYGTQSTVNATWDPGYL